MGRGGSQKNPDEYLKNCRSRLVPLRSIRSHCWPKCRGCSYIWCQANASFCCTNSRIQSRKSSVTVCSRFAASGTWTTCRNWWSHMNSAVGWCQPISLWPKGQVQSDHDLKQTSRPTSERLRRNDRFLEWTGQSPDLKDWAAVTGPWTGSLRRKSLQCGWIKTILQRRLNQNSSTVI